MTHELQEIIELGAADGVFYAHQWFPNSFRQESPPIHSEVWKAIDDTENEFIGLEMFRGSAKTTLCRCAASRRVAYAISNTILFVSATAGHAERSVRWLKRQVEKNTAWTQAFGLRKGSKWRDNEIEIWNDLYDRPIYVLALGITGQTRGLNLDDYRPDFIIVDDPCDEENTGTEEQREKTSALFFGSLQQSLAPTSENPHAKMALLQTGLHKKDLIHLAHEDPTWKTFKYSCFDENNRSTWPIRFPTEYLHKRKQAFIERQQIRYWLREMECKIVSAETAAFNTNLLKFYDEPPETMSVFIGIDPARETKLKTKAHKAAIVAIGVYGSNAYLLQYWAEPDQNPEAIWNAYFAMAVRWRPLITAVESHAYQQTLAWYFRQRMKQLNTYFTIREYNDRRKKPDRIRQAYTQRIVDGTFRVRKEHNDFVEALAEYTNDVDIDVLDAGAIALDVASPALRAATAGGEDESVIVFPHERRYSTEFEAPCP